VQKNKKSGLPENIKMRHDIHFVDLLSTKAAGPSIRMIPIDRISPNPQQARSELGNINELMDSIREKGILEPILVRSKGNQYEIIAGERRYIASKRIGMSEIPCIEMDVKDNEALELALIENLQRKDLDVFEEADGLRALVNLYGYSHQQISKKIGKARSTITEIIAVSKIPKNIRNICKQSNVLSRSTLIEIAKQKNQENMIKLLNEIKDRDLKRMDTRELSKTLKGTQKKIQRYVYNYVPKESKSYKLRIEFKKPNVSKEEIIEILKDLITKLQSE